jgi:hypothetical protein
MPAEPRFDDPFEAHFHREPLGGAEVLVVVLHLGAVAPAEAVAAGLVALLAERGRPAQSRVVLGSHLGAAIEAAALETAAGLVLITTAIEPWTAAHLDPLLDAIDRADHVVGRRAVSGLAHVARWLRGLAWRFLFAVPVADVHHPCRLHRREQLAAIPLQSASWFVDVELLAKATFLGHLIAEAEVPALAALDWPSQVRDFLTVFRRPIFVRPPALVEDGPAEAVP